jgi:hypothetical protein
MSAAVSSRPWKIKSMVFSIIGCGMLRMFTVSMLKDLKD